ncbi:MAG: ribosomal protein S18-alanine N-acetyltransferase [Oricola sp.]
MPSDQPPLRIAPFEPDNAEALAALHARCFPRPWKAADFRRYAETASYPGLLAWTAERRLIGFIIVSIAADQAEILTIGTDEDARRHGVASAMLSRMIEDVRAQGADAVFLEVGVNNAAARALYGRHGFEVQGRRADYYTTPEGSEDALIMKKVL